MIIGISGHIGSGKDLIGKIIQYLTWENKDSEYKFEGNLNDLLQSEAMIFVPKGIRGFVNIGKESGWQIKKFADKLKDIVCLLIGCTREQLEDREFKEKELGEEWWYYKLPTGELLNYKSSKEFNFTTIPLIKLTPCKLLQLLRTECGRQIIHPDIWVNALMSGYNGVICSKKESNDFVLAGEEEIYVKYPNWIITDVRFPNEVKAIKDRGGILIRIERDYILTGGPEDPKIQHESETALDNHQNWNYVIENNTDIVGLIQKIKDILLFEGIIKEKL